MSDAKNNAATRPGTPRNPWRKKLAAWWRDFEWPVLGALALTALALGYWGFTEQLRASNEPHGFWDVLYVDLQLFVLSSGNLGAPLHPALNIARFLAPFVAGYTAFQALSEIFKNQLESLRLRLLRDHVVICGLGTKGLLLAREFIARGRKVVVIEVDEENDAVPQCRDMGCIVRIGDMTEPAMLRRAGVPDADCIFALCGDDGLNAEVAVRAASIVGTRRHRPLTCVVHIFDPQLCSLLRERELDARTAHHLRVEFFNIFDLGARTLFDEHALLPTPPAATGETKPTRVVVIGVGHLGRSIVLEAARRWRTSDPRPADKLPISLIDTRAGERAEALSALYPALPRVCKLEPHKLDVRSMEFARADFTAGVAGRTLCFVCLNNESLTLTTALTVARRLRGHDASIVACMSDNTGLAMLLRDVAGDAGGFKNVSAFALHDRTCRPEEMTRGTHEILARAIHEEYLRNQRAAGDTSKTNRALVPWDALPEVLRESNRHQADDVRAKLESVRCDIEAMTNWDEPLFEFQPDELETLSIREHERWMNERLRGGWKLGAVKDAAAKTHPCLVPYADLPEPEKEKDRNVIRHIPVVLANVGFRVRRLPPRA